MSANCRMLVSAMGKTGNGNVIEGQGPRTAQQGKPRRVALEMALDQWQQTGPVQTPRLYQDRKKA